MGFDAFILSVIAVWALCSIAGSLDGVWQELKTLRLYLAAEEDED